MIHLNPNTVPSNSKKKPTIAITKLGVFSISQTAVERAGFKEGDHVAFSFDDKSKTGDLYLYKSEIGFPCRKNQAMSKGLLFNSVGLRAELKRLLGIEHDGRIVVPIGPESTTLFDPVVEAWPLITRNIKLA